MSLKLISYEGDYRAWKILIAAAYNDVQLEQPAFDFKRDGAGAELLAKNPVGKVPVLETPHGCLFESNAIARYVARIRADTGLYGGSFFESALVDQWIDFCANELEAPRAIWLYPTLGLLDFNETAYDEAKKDVTAALTILENHLFNNAFLASNQISLADITVASALVALYRELFAPEYVTKFPNVTRWFTYCVNQNHFSDVIGKVEFAKHEKQAYKGGKQARGEEKEHKEEAPKEGKGKKEKKQKGGDEKPADAPKEGKGKKGKKEKEKEAEAPAATANEALEDAAEAERAAEAKRGNVLDDLPPSKLVLDDAKRLYFKEKPFYKGFWDEFWALWDPAGYCCYFSDYKFQNENQLSFMTGNAILGFTQRLDKARKYMWGVLNVSCVNEDTPPYYISGVWLFRGTDIPAEMKECSDSEYYVWTRLDLSKESDRKILIDEFQADNLPRGEVIDRRFFK